MLEHHGDAVGRAAGDRLAVHQELAARSGRSGRRCSAAAWSCRSRDGPTTHMISSRSHRERQLMEGDDGAVEKELAGALGDDRRRIGRTW